jgi:hypothetical protein
MPRVLRSDINRMGIVEHERNVRETQGVAEFL